jgi:4-nitrophenyl phosphatase
VTRLRDLGAPVSADRVVSSPRATALYLAELQPIVRRVLAVGASGLDRELRDVGLDVVNAGHVAERMASEGLDGWRAAGQPDAVVAGLDPNLTYLRIAAAADCIRAGARFVATNRDPVYPTERGLRPGAGSVVAAIEATAGLAPTVIGKPEPLLMETAARSVGREAREAIVVGDGLGTDLAAARAVGARCVLMLTGVASRQEVESLPPAGRPEALAADAAELAAALEGLSRPGR